VLLQSHGGPGVLLDGLTGIPGTAHEQPSGPGPFPLAELEPDNSMAMFGAAVVVAPDQYAPTEWAPRPSGFLGMDVASRLRPRAGSLRRSARLGLQRPFGAEGVLPRRPRVGGAWIEPCSGDDGLIDRSTGSA
jgi:hypothetical protein